MDNILERLAMTRYRNNDDRKYQIAIDMYKAILKDKKDNPHLYCKNCNSKMEMVVDEPWAVLPFKKLKCVNPDCSVISFLKIIKDNPEELLKFTAEVQSNIKQKMKKFNIMENKK